MESKAKKTVNSKLLTISGVLLIIIAACILILFLLHGEERTSGGFPEPESSKVVSCESSATKYPLFSYTNVISTNMKIDATFSDEKLSSISLKHVLTYDNARNAINGETINHSAMNISFTDAGMSIETLRANYSVVDNKFTMTLYGRKTDVTEATRKYLLIDGYTENMRGLVEQYSRLGLECIEKNAQV